MRIGDFDTAWETYDHSDGPQLFTQAKNRIKAGANRPNWRLVVGGRNLTDRLISYEVTFDVSGDSGMRFTVGTALGRERLERVPVNFWIGYGTKLVPYYHGQLADATDSRSGRFCEATSYGLGPRMGMLYFGGRVNYSGNQLEAAWWDIINRFGADAVPGGPDVDQFRFYGPASATVEGDLGSFGLENSLLEAEQALLEPQGMRVFDQVGGLRIATWPSRLDALVGITPQHIFTEADYSGPFSVSQPERNVYDKAIVFRRTEEYAGGGEGGQGEGMTQAEDGSWVPNEFYGSFAETESNAAGDPDKPKAAEYAVYAERPIANTSPVRVSAHRLSIVPDFTGTQPQAGRRAEQLANTLSHGIGPFTLESCPPVDLGIDDIFGVEQVQEVRTADSSLQTVHLGAKYAFLYACIVEATTLTGEPGTMSMSITGQAVQTNSRLVRPASTINLGVAV